MEIRTLSAGVVVVRPEAGKWMYLMLRAYSYWDFPKGIVEPGEGPIDAARREVEEETGIKDLDFHWGYDYRETEPYNNGKVARYYLAETGTRDIDLPVNPHIGRPEHEEYKWVTYEEAFSLAAPRIRHVLEWVKRLLAGR
ncbi:MAG: NUDIX domain-containing protein [Desulfobacteraceae bacterium]|nr:NUDIX domain-containing protein [Desulfobacteraceae bacterium]